MKHVYLNVLACNKQGERRIFYLGYFRLLLLEINNFSALSRTNFPLFIRSKLILALFEGGFFANTNAVPEYEGGNVNR